MSVLPYVPPRSPLDRPSPELVVLFLEAVARVTPAFRELRDRIFPKCDLDHNRVPLAEVDSWLERWHLDFENYQLREMIESWTIEVLQCWHKEPEHREALRVDRGWWEFLRDPRRSAGDKEPCAMLSRWNPERESYEAWSARLRTKVEGYLREEKRQNEAELEKYDAVPYAPENPLAFEWLALSVCCRRSDGWIALRSKQHPPEVKRAIVKKARRRLALRLGVGTLDTPC